MVVGVVVVDVAVVVVAVVFVCVRGCIGAVGCEGEDIFVHVCGIEFVNDEEVGCVGGQFYGEVFVVEEVVVVGCVACVQICVVGGDCDDGGFCCVVC